MLHNAEVLCFWVQDGHSLILVFTLFVSGVGNTGSMFHPMPLSRVLRGVLQQYFLSNSLLGGTNFLLFN